MTIRVVIADDHRVVRDGLCYLLSQEPDIEVAGEAGDGRQTVDVVAATRPDVLLLDLYMPGLDGHAVLAALRDKADDPARRPAVVVLTSAAEDEHLLRAMQAGATSYLLKTSPADHVIAAVRNAAAGTASLSPELLTRLTQALRRPPPPDPLRALSPRERDVLRLIAQGHSNRQIARDLAIGEQTVKNLHVRGYILAKLGLQDREPGRDLRPPAAVKRSGLSRLPDCRRESLPRVGVNTEHAATSSRATDKRVARDIENCIASSRVDLGRITKSIVGRAARLGGGDREGDVASPGRVGDEGVATGPGPGASRVKPPVLIAAGVGGRDDECGGGLPGSGHRGVRHLPAEAPIGAEPTIRSEEE